MCHWIGNGYTCASYILAFACLLSACEPVSSRRLASAYYPIDSLVTNQITLLSGRSVVINKVASVNGSKDESRLTGGKAVLEKELGVFRDLDVINKAVNFGKYEVHDAQDTKSNLTIRSYTAIDDKLPVRFVRIFFLHTPEKIKRLEGGVQQRNSMYIGERNLVLEFSEVNKQARLARYSIHGGQKMLLGDSLQYAINGKLDF